MGGQLACQCGCGGTTISVGDWELDVHGDTAAQSSKHNSPPKSASEELPFYADPLVDLALQHFLHALAISDEASAIGGFIRELWPLVLPGLGKCLERCTRRSLEHALARLPRGMRGEARLGSVSPQPLVRIGAVRSCRQCLGNANGREVTLQLAFDTDVDLELRLGAVGLLVSRIGFDGDANIVFQTEEGGNNTASLAGLHLAFLNPPDVRLGLMRLDGVRDWAEIDAKTRHLVNSLFRNTMVLPQHVSLPICKAVSQKESSQSLVWLSPVPKGMLRVRILRARGLSASTKMPSSSASFIIPDPFCCLRIGAHDLRTPAQFKTCNPQWTDVGGEFLVYDERQCLQLDAFNADSSVSDNLLGSLPHGYSIAKLLEQQAEARVVACSGTEVGVWLPLVGSILEEEGESSRGAVYVHVDYFRLEPQQNIASEASQSDHLLLTACIHGAAGFAPEYAPSSCALSCEGCRIESNEAQRVPGMGGRWSWEEALYVIVRAGGSAEADLEVNVQGQWLKITERSLHVNMLLAPKQTQMQSVYNLKLPGSNASISVTWHLHRLVQKEENEALIAFAGGAPERRDAPDSINDSQVEVNRSDHTVHSAGTMLQESSVTIREVPNTEEPSEVKVSFKNEAVAISAGSDSIEAPAKQKPSKKAKTRRLVSFGEWKDPDSMVSLDLSTSHQEPIQEEKNKQEKVSAVREYRSIGNALFEAGKSDAPSATGTLVSSAPNPREATISCSQNIQAASLGEEDRPEEGQVSARGSPRSGMQAIADSLQANHLAWGDGAAGWHPGLIRNPQLQTRCWGAMEFADGFDGAIRFHQD